MILARPKLEALSGSQVFGGQVCIRSSSSRMASIGLAAMNIPQEGQYASMSLV